MGTWGGAALGIFRNNKSAMKRWVASKRSLVAQIPRPTDYPQAHSVGPDADRVLVFGTGLAVGWGSTSYHDALPGELATALSDLTSRGTDVDVIARPELLIADARGAIVGAKLWRFDAIVVSLGLCDALQLTDVDEWRRTLTYLLGEMTNLAAPSTRIVVLAIEPVGSISAYEGAHAAAADAHAVLLNAATAEVCADRSSVAFLTLAANPTHYSELAVEIADDVIDSLNSGRNQSVGAIRGPAGQDAVERERERQEGVDSVSIVDTLEEDRFDKIVTMARQLYGTSGAAFAIVDHGRVWHKSRSEGVPLEVEKDQSFCSTTIMLRGPHVVPDMQVEMAPSDSSAADDVGVRFYAGYPVESPSGEQIGALCIFDEKPRERADFDDAMLRQLALLIQAELRVEAIA